MNTKKDSKDKKEEKSESKFKSFRNRIAFSNQSFERQELLYAMWIIPSLIYISFEAFYKLCNVFYARMIWIPGIIFSYVLFLGIYYVFLAIINNSYITSIIMSVILVIFGVGNQLKIAYSDNPFFLSDILFVNSAGTFTDILKDTVFDLLTKYIFIIVPFIIALYFICKYARKHNTYKMNIRKRISYAIIPTAVIIFISLPIANVSQPMLTVFFNIKDRQNAYATTNMGYYFKFGVFGGLYGQMLENRLVKPDEYDPEYLNSVLEENKDKDNNTRDLGQPNIVMIFSESFWNIDSMDDVKFDKKIASNFESLSKEGILIDMISPSYGGISSNVEYEMLTGSSIKFFSAGYIPYMQLYRDDKYINAPSIIKELSNNGYTTHISSTWESSLFNCNQVYQYYDVDKVDYQDDMTDAKNKGGRISDDYVANRIIDELRNKPKDEKLFTMTLTAQAHMPYKKDKYKKYDIDIKNSKLNSEENDTLLSYAQGIYDADKQLKKVYDYIQTMDEPTILIFYGDHLPYLKTESGEDLTEKLSYFNTGDEKTDLYNRYHTQCLILGNYDIGEDDIGYMGPDLVMTYLVNNMSLNLSPYYKWLYTTIGDLPASNLYVSVDSDGEKYLTSKLKGKMKKSFDLRKNMNWKYFVEVDNDGYGDEIKKK